MFQLCRPLCRQFGRASAATIASEGGGGGGNAIPANALTLNGVPVTLNGSYITLNLHLSEL